MQKYNLRFKNKLPPAHQFQDRYIKVDFNPEQIAVIVCDMWDQHHCKSATARVSEMAPTANRFLSSIRKKGSIIIHVPSGCMKYYAIHSQREHSISISKQYPNLVFPKTNFYVNSAFESPIPLKSGCSCAQDHPCAEPQAVWTRQNDQILIEKEDFISDVPHEIFSIFEYKKIDTIIILGVHTNICIMVRPYGIRSLVYHKKKVILCRDLTDSYHRDQYNHFLGTKLMVSHIEMYWCPTMISSYITNDPPFRFNTQEIRI